MYVHGITSCPNRFSRPTARCRCRSEGYPSAFKFLCSGRYGCRQSLSRRWWFFLWQARCCRNRGGHQQVYQWLGEPGAIWFWQVAFIAKQTASSCRHVWQQDVSYWGVGGRLSSQNEWGTAEEVYAFWALIVPTRSGVQVLEYYIIIHTFNYYIVHTWFLHICTCTYTVMTFIYKTSTYENSAYMSMPCICMYVHCTYMCMFLISVILHRPDGLKSSSKRLLLCCKTLHSILRT